MLWHQKSREKWIKFGDRNSSFFHAQTIIRRKKNRIHGLQLPNGTWTSDDTILQDEAQKYFKNLLANTQPHQNRTFNFGPHPTIVEPSKISLTSTITKTEVFNALNSMKPYKAPGPYGFQCIFFKQYWHIVGDDIFHLVQSAFQNGHFDPKISSTLIALIPKIDSPNTFKDLRPIILCNIIYKIITIVLVHRLRPILNNIIGPYQSSFLPSRGTSDNSIVLQEIVHFPRPSHDLCQGDPLSPYLFILCMEKLSVAISSAVLQGEWEPIQITNNGPQISHLFFADDVLLFIKAKNAQIRFVADLFDRFSKASGLKINLSKSRAFYSTGTPQRKISSLTSISGIRNTSSLDRYLGFPIIKGRTKRSDFFFIIEKNAH